jgi:hypothetical protein
VEGTGGRWQRFARPDFGLEFSYPEVTPKGQAVERDDEPFREYARVHLSSPDREELYLEVVRFHDLAPEEEYETHRFYLDRRFGENAVSVLTETSLHGRRAWAYSFRWEDRERAVTLVRANSETYRIIHNPRSSLNDDLIASITFR